MKGVSPSFARLYPKLEEIPDMPIQFSNDLMSDRVLRSMNS